MPGCIDGELTQMALAKRAAHFFIKQAMRYSFFHHRRHVEVNVLRNGDTWRWAFVIDGQRPSVDSKTLISTAAKGLRKACMAARKVIEHSVFD